MKYSMQTKLILIMALMLFALTASIGAANIFFLPHYYQMTKVSKMENAYHSVLSGMGKKVNCMMRLTALPVIITSVSI